MKAIMSLLATLLLLLIGGSALIRRFSDGPLGPLPGGELRTGPLCEGAVDWSFAREVSLMHLQLETPLASRTTGVLYHEGGLYVPCDLGFIWRRVSPPAKWAMAVAWFLKRWHEDALRDGRVVIRIRGTRYACQATRVTDPNLLDVLRGELEQRAEGFLSAPLAQTPSDPDAIWFFRLDPRTASTESTPGTPYSPQRNSPRRSPG